MTRWLFAALSVLAIACEAPPKTPQELLVGSWLYQNDAARYAVSIAYDGTRWNRQLLKVSAGAGQAQVYSGTYTAAEKTLTMRTLNSSCPITGRLDPAVAAYDVTDKLLTLSDETGGMTLTRIESTGTANVYITYGCFKDDGTFAPGPVTAIREAAR